MEKKAKFDILVVISAYIGILILLYILFESLKELT